MFGTGDELRLNPFEALQERGQVPRTQTQSAAMERDRTASRREITRRMLLASARTVNPSKSTHPPAEAATRSAALREEERVLAETLWSRLRSPGRWVRSG